MAPRHAVKPTVTLPLPWLLQKEIAISNRKFRHDHQKISKNCQTSQVNGLSKLHQMSPPEKLATHLMNDLACLHGVVVTSEGRNHPLRIPHRRVVQWTHRELRFSMLQEPLQQVNRPQSFQSGHLQLGPRKRPQPMEAATMNHLDQRPDQFRPQNNPKASVTVQFTETIQTMSSNPIKRRRYFRSIPTRLRQTEDHRHSDNVRAKSLWATIPSYLQYVVK